MMPQEAWSQDIQRRSKGDFEGPSFLWRKEHTWLKNVVFPNKYQMIIPRLKMSINSM